MDRIRHIDTRNLVVCETFDDFAKKVGQCDQNVEDIVGYVTSVSRVFYWLNVESVWGVIGFNWEPTSLSDLEGYPNPWERLEHVIAEGNNIDGEHGELTPEGEKQMEEALERREMVIKKGYGYFVRTTVPFDIIPKLPDGYRITEFRNTFNNIASNDITLQKSDWSNVLRVQNVAPVGKHVSMDLTDAPITYFEPWVGGNDTGKMLYIKADLKDATWKFNSNGFSNSLPRGVLEVDENNKDLDINLANSYNINNPNHINIHYIGEDTFIDSNYFTNFENIKLFGNCYAYADTNKLVIHSMPTKDYDNTAYNYGLSVANREQVQNANIYHFRPKDEQDVDLTINTEYCRNVNFAYILGLLNYTESNYIPFTGQNPKNNVFKLLPIKYEGAIDSIDFYNPYCSIYDSFPALNQNVVSKIVNSRAGGFMPFPTFYTFPKCNYTLDLSNYTYYNIYDGFQRDTSDESGITELERLTCLDYSGNQMPYLYKDGLPTLTGINHTFERFTFPRFGDHATNQSNTGTRWIVFEIPSIKSNVIDLQYGYIKSGIKIEGSKFYDNYKLDDSSDESRRGLIVENSNIPSFKVYPVNGSMRFRLSVHSESGTNINFVEFTTLDKDILRASVIDTVPNTQIVFSGATYTQPYIKSNLDTPFTSTGKPIFRDIDGWPWDNNRYFNPSFIFIYRTHISFGERGTSTLTPFTTSVIENILNTGLEPLTNTEEYDKFWVRVSRSFLNACTGGEAAIRNRVETVCHYHLEINESV